MNSYSKLLVGLHLESVDKRDHTWTFTFAEEIMVATESPWRLIAEERIAVTSEDHGHQFGLPEPVDAISRVFSATTGRQVEAVSVAVVAGDLVVDFGGRVQLEFLQTSCGYESWRLSAPGCVIVCKGGGDVVRV